MVVENFPNFLEWIGGAAGQFGLICLAGVLLGLFFGYVVSSFRYGPFEAFYVVAQVVAQALPDLFGTSFRRIYAMARLAVKEALRRRVILVTFGIFALALLFGGWFMNAGSENPDRIYVNFVLWGTQLLVLLVGMLISAFSLPEDIKKKTIYTIVTKPVRATEIVLGRILGFGALGTVLLAAMGIISFFFVFRYLSHEHLLVGDTQTISAFAEVDPNTRLSRRGKRVSDNAIMEAETTFDSGHSHRVELIADIRDDGEKPMDMSNVWAEEQLADGRTLFKRLICVPVGGHTHRVLIDGEGDEARIRLGPAIGYFRARNPIYAETLKFHDKTGNDSKGSSVGREWEYRGYIDGGSNLEPNSLAKAMFDFENFTPERVGARDILPLELTLSVFRTFIADVEKRVAASLQFESIPDDANFDERVVSEPIIFETNEYTIQTLAIPRKLKGRKIGPEGNEIEVGVYDLFDDFAEGNGKFRLNLRCEDTSQYIGVARADVYFRAPDGVYWWNFVKGYIGIWCQMMIVISLGVALSTFLSAPIVIMGSLVVIVVGFFTPFIRNMTEIDVSGGGPIESFFRIVTQQNMEVDLETSVATTIMEEGDKLLVKVLEAVTYLAPNFAQLNFSDFLTYGYVINVDRMLVAVAITLAFCTGLSILGYFSLKTREIAK